MAKSRDPGLEAVLRRQLAGEYLVAFLQVLSSGIEAGSRARRIALIKRRIGHIRAIDHGPGICNCRAGRK